jgi:hypothetical protein
VTDTSLFIATWDLTDNKEVRMTELPYGDVTENSICKGLKQKFNYIVD